jgi:IclR family pca regulon transcriptional regulator
MSDRDGFKNEEFVKSLAKGLAVIESFGPDFPEMTLTTVAKRNGLSPGSARRVLQTLQRLGYVGLKGQRFRLQARTLQLGYSYLSSLPIVSLIQPKLSALSEELDESCAFSILDGWDSVCIARATAKRLERDYMGVGARWPAHAASAGKVLLGALTDAEILKRRAEVGELRPLTPFTVTDMATLLQQVAKARRDGWCYINQETAMGIASIAVAIRVEGETRYALSSSARVNVSAATTIERALPKLLGAAATITGTLAAKF